MLKLTNTQKKMLKDAIKESVKTGAKVMVTGVALSAALRGLLPEEPFGPF